MEFDFVVYRGRGKDKEIPLAGFWTLREAQKYAEIIAFDYLSKGYFFIKAPEGKYIMGCDADDKKSGTLWYKPKEQAYVYDPHLDKPVMIEELW